MAAGFRRAQRGREVGGNHCGRCIDGCLRCILRERGRRQSRDRQDKQTKT